MATLSQEGFFYAGTVGFAVLITLVDALNVPVITTVTPVPAGQIGLSEIQSFELEIKRPDSTTFTRTLAAPASFVTGAVQYVLQTGDLNAGGRYHYILTLVLSGNRRLPVAGNFSVLR